MRFGRTSAHNMMHFGKRGNSNESGEDGEAIQIKPEDLPNEDQVDDKLL